MRQPTGTPPRAILIVGTSPWLERVTALGGSTDSDHSLPRETANWQVVAHVETQAAIAGDSHEYIDCVVTDDPTVVGAFDQPVIVGPAASHIEAATESRPTETTGGSSVEVDSSASRVRAWRSRNMPSKPSSENGLRGSVNPPTGSSYST